MTLAFFLGFSAVAFSHGIVDSMRSALASTKSGVGRPAAVWLGGEEGLAGVLMVAGVAGEDSSFLVILVYL